MTRRRAERGNALIVVLLVTTLLILLGSAFLATTVSAMWSAARERSALQAFQAAEAGLMAGKLAFEKTNQVLGIPTVEGSLGRATYTVRPGVGSFGQEAWLQWGYEERASRFNPVSRIGQNPRIGWRSEFTPARNGVMSGGVFFSNNIFAVVSTGMAFISYEEPSTNRVQVAAFDSLDGSLRWTTAGTSLLGNGYKVSPMAMAQETGTLYFTLTTDAAPAGTVRLLALSVSGSGVSLKWFFDTGRHGAGSAPALYNPDPSAPGDEIIYFTVAEAPDLTLTDTVSATTYPRGGHRAEQILVYAVRDDVTAGTAKWAHPFPDPVVAAATDYPTETWDVAAGFVDRPEDVAPVPPDEDPLADYYNEHSTMRSAVRGDLYYWFDPQSLSPPVLHVDDGGTPGFAGDDRIHIFVYYSAVTNKDIAGSSAYQSSSTPPAQELLHWQAEILALLDTPAGRFPRFKWTYNPPAYDKNRSDAVPWNGYGEENYETWFEQTSAPMVAVQATDQDGLPYPDLDGDGQGDVYPVIYMPYESLEWATPYATNNLVPEEISYAMVMGVRDLWDDFEAGRTSRRLDPYWTDAAGENPYVWAEGDIQTVGDLPNAALFPGCNRSRDIDVEGESLAYDSHANVLFFVFNHDLNPTTANLESLRVHAISARNGGGRAVVGGLARHLWDHQMPAVFNGELYNATPALAGGYVYVLSRTPEGSNQRVAHLNILNASDGTPTPASPITVDTDCDGANLAPSIANEAIYVGTYDHAGQAQRLYALSPNIWILSTGVSADGRASRTLALREKDGRLVEWREGGFAGGGP